MMDPSTAAEGAPPEGSNATIAPNAEPFLPFSVHMEYFSWLDYAGFLFQFLLALCGSILNGFILWVFGREESRSFGDVLQMNMAICDVIDGIMGSSIITASRVIMVSWPMTGFKTFFVSVCFNMAAVYFEDLATVVVTVLRTRQVSIFIPKRKQSRIQ